jgi:hypothetical protein
LHANCGNLSISQSVSAASFCFAEMVSQIHGRRARGVSLDSA